MMPRKPLLCIAGGGTGGHVMPAISLADAARKSWPDLRVRFIGARRGLEAQLLPKRQESVLLLNMHAVQGFGIWQRLRVLCWELPRSVMQIRRDWRDEKPDVLVGVGGYASVSGVIAAIICRVPVVLYEQNAVPGMVNRKLVRFCRRIMLGFAEAAPALPASKRVVTGNIIRHDIHQLRYKSHQPPCLLVLGGSQGARFLNATVPGACALLAGKGLEFTVAHICGDDAVRISEVGMRYQQAAIEHEIIGFCHDMPAFYARGDFLIARAGAMSVGEAGVAAIPTLFVPLPHAADQHQWFNARAAADQQGALLWKQAELTAEKLAEAIESILFDPEKKQAMSRNMQSWAATSCLLDAEQRQMQVLAEFLEVAV